MTVISSDIASSHGALARRIARTVFPLAIFLSAALLFSVQPMFSKMVLPILGGSAAVWSIAMVVFQGLMLGGYTYAHLLTRYLPIRFAVLAHITLLASATLFLPVAIASGFDVPPESGLSLWVVGLFLASVGIPCFALSANAPLLQAWFAASNDGNAYLLYRASNLGSFLILLAYPFLIEPMFGLSLQSLGWSLAYAALVFTIAGAGATALRSPLPMASAMEATPVIATSGKQKLSWLVLGFIPSGLLVAATAHIATDIASGPYIWIIPLALYLLTFVLAFSDKPVIAPKFLLVLQPVTIAMVVLWSGRNGWLLSLAGHLFAFFVAAMVCQYELYRRRPPTAALTHFYLWMSLGGVLGGSFAALAAPVLFNSDFEYALLMFAAILIRPDVRTITRENALRDIAFVAAVIALCQAFYALFGSREVYDLLIIALAVLMAVQFRKPMRLLLLAAALLVTTNLYDPSQNIVARERSFYAIHKVFDLNDGKFRVLYHGTVAHGAEVVKGSDGAKMTGRPEPLTYYYDKGPYAEVVAAVRATHGGRLNRVAAVGLGMGALSCQKKPGESWTFYEIDPVMDRIARNPKIFRSLSECAPDAPTVIGDGRLMLKKAKAGIDILILDAFSSDSVPAHLLTREAFALYKAKLGDDGAIAIHISNRNLELSHVVAAGAAANGMVTRIIVDPTNPDTARTMHMKGQIAIVAQSEAQMDSLKLPPAWKRIAGDQSHVWTDDYSNILDALLLKMRE